MGKNRATVSASLIRVLLRYAASIDIDVEGLGKSTGLDLDTPGNPDARVAAEEFNLIWGEVARRADDRDFGLHFAEASRAFLGGDILSAVMMNCPTVGSALEKQARYHGLATDFVQLDLKRQGDYAYYSWQPAGAEVRPERHLSEAVLCALVFGLRRLTENKISLVEIRFQHPQPKEIAEHRRILGTPLAFARPRNELVLKGADLEQAIFLANPAHLERLEQFAQELLERLYAPDTWSDKVTHLIGQTLVQGDKPDLGSIARELAISKRHLQNQLNREGTTYRTLLDEVRKEMALGYLKKPGATLCDLAFLLGYSEQSAFSHAFKRWTGSSPKDYRNR